jgi:hypothetical protein
LAKIFDILSSFAQRRELNRDDGQSVEEILSKLSTLDTRLEIAVCGCQYPDIDFAWSR